MIPSRSHVGLAPWHKGLLWLSGLLLLLSGLGWLGVHYRWGAGAGPWPAPAEGMLMRWHGAGVFLSLFACGLLAAGHVGIGWRWTAHPRRRRQRRSGLILCAALAWLIGSGYGLYYLVPDDGRLAWGLWHAGVGAGWAAVAWWHVGAARRRARAGSHGHRTEAGAPARS